MTGSGHPDETRSETESADAFTQRVRLQRDTAKGLLAGAEQALTAYNQTIIRMTAEQDALRRSNEILTTQVRALDQQLVRAIAERDAARAEVTRLEAENERLNGQLGECIGCVDEPDECCPQHGRTCADWIEIASGVIGRTNAVRDLLEQAAHWHVYEPRELGEAFLVETVRDWLDEVRAALDAWPAAALGGGSRRRKARRG